MALREDIFREYDIRGIVDKDLTTETVELLGKGIGTYFRQKNAQNVALGGDCRLSTPGFAEALSRGLRTTGCSVTHLGTIPTPLLYFTMFTKPMEAGVMITGSHNPPDFNGFKMMIGKETLYGETIKEIYRIITNGHFLRDEEGTESSYDIRPEYHDWVVDNITLSRKLTVVVDAGNGTGGAVAVPLFRDLGCEVIPLYCEMDGNFPNHHPDPTLPEALQELILTVAKTKADLGIAYDGDSDRIGVIDDAGKIIWGDMLMILFARDILAKNPGATVISEVKASKLLYDEIEKLGGRPIMWKTGHSLMKKKIVEERALLAGEMSGHIFFADKFFGFDDAIYASARVLEILSNSETKLSQMLSDLPLMHNTPEIRVYASDEVKFKIVDGVKAELSQRLPVIDIDGVRALYPKGWGLVRASNTQGALVLRFEAETEEDLKAIKKDVEQTIEDVIKKLDAG